MCGTLATIMPMKPADGTICTRMETHRVDHTVAFGRRRLHQSGRKLFQPPAPDGSRNAPPHRWSVSQRLRGEASWREDNRRVPNGDQTAMVTRAVVTSRGSFAPMEGVLAARRLIGQEGTSHAR